MFFVEADKSKNIMTIAFTEHVGAVEMERGLESVRSVVVEMQPGFALLANLTGLESMDADCAPYIGTIMEELAKSNLKQVVRVIPDPKKDIGLTIISRFHYGPDIHVTTVESLAEAMESLST